MKTPLILLPLTFLACVNPASAEVFILKDGSKVEGKILKETPESYLIEVQVTKSIKDDKTIAKADVAKVEAEKFDEKAFEKLKGSVPTPDLLTNDDYDKRILALTKFVTDYPKSPLVSEVNPMLATLKSEGTVVVGGGFKLGGKMITAAEYKADAYEIDARIVESRIRDSYAKGDLLGALRGLAKIDKEYISTAPRKLLAPLKLQILQAYKAQIAEELSTYDARVAERKQGVSRMSGEDRSRTEAALAEEDQAAAKRLKSEIESQQRWVTVNPFDKASLTNALQAIEQEKSDQYSAPTADGGKLYREAYKTIQTSEDPQVIREALGRTSEVSMPAKYTALLNAAVKEKGIKLDY